MRTFHPSLRLTIALALVACTARAPDGNDDTNEHANDGPNDGPNDDKRPNACATCHRAEFEDVKHPLHVGLKPMTCGVCHTQERWRPSVLRHEWALTGAHTKVDCFGCHVGAPPVFRGTGKTCVDCHRKDAAKVDFADHATFGIECAKCHTTDAWKPATGPAHEEPKPEPEPTATAATSSTSPTNAPKTPPKTSPVKPRPKSPKPTPVPTTSASTKPPDVVTRPSRRVKSDSP